MAYVYRHVRTDKNQPFYIGIGTDNSYRRSRSKCNRNRYWKNITNCTDYNIDIIFDDLTIEEAKLKEIEFISLYKRISDGGTLCNITIGGDGTLGYRHSEETKKKIAESNKSENISIENRMKKSNYAKNRTEEHRMKLSRSMSGKIFSEESRKKMSLSRTGKIASMETRLKISKSNTGKKHSKESIDLMKHNCHLSKTVLCLNNGIYYDSSIEAAIAFGLNPNTVHRVFNGKYKNRFGLIYV